MDLTQSGLTRSTSFRATPGNKIYKLALVDKVSGEHPTVTRSRSLRSSDLPSHSHTNSGSSFESTDSGSGGGAPSETTSVSSSAVSPEVEQNKRRARRNRLSIAFPKAPTMPASQPVVEESPSVAPQLYLSPKPPQPAPENAGGADFLTLLAAKQRRVLELKDELARAQAELKLLQKQWSVQEDRSRRTSMAPKPVARSSDLAATATAKINSLVNSRARGNRASFDGSDISGSFAGNAGAHRRDSSDYSPVSSPARPGRAAGPFGIRSASMFESHESTPESEGDGTPTGFPVLGGVGAASDYEFYEEPGYGRQASGQHQIKPDDVIHMGKKIAEGLNNQFWTFYEDIKQAAIGEDLIPSALGSPGLYRPNPAAEAVPASARPDSKQHVVSGSSPNAVKSASSSSSFSSMHTIRPAQDHVNKRNSATESDDYESGLVDFLGTTSLAPASSQQVKSYDQLAVKKTRRSSMAVFPPRAESSPDVSPVKPKYDQYQQFKNQLVDAPGSNSLIDFDTEDDYDYETDASNDLAARARLDQAASQPPSNRWSQFFGA
ncbi:uncharacterized protein V1510DRAFT_407134 [Dipodascopsis tothii]|uniref:uncharacterized protein n=1 Tax=Dipodascopsis tothii TaxID=44089 RepID=UPI0034CF924E